MSTIRRRIREEVESLAAEASIADVRVGLGYTAAMLKDSRTGVAYTVVSDLHKGCTVFGGIRPMAGRPAPQLLELIESGDTLEATVGLATANALSNVQPSDALHGDVLTALKLDPTDTVAMIGYFGPLVTPLKETGGRSGDFRGRHPAGVGPPSRRRGVHQTSEGAGGNHILGHHCERHRRCTAGLRQGTAGKWCCSVPQHRWSPRSLGPPPVTYLSGITIEDSSGILQVVSEGGGTRLFKPYVSKWNVAMQRR